ncbi:7-carboxy-7-deazaguanine synthase QueE [Sulfurimonas sp.]|uniref:7-carboxy-7-deazaguanine synthase QueE n=1 Tax=Sulfurimonas sp. TaxID=2022749 RepID=UPI002AB12E0E|nr:7-carboxy-7-deazaguanine synthase QueE [Sulfurimonas sp.]
MLYLVEHFYSIQGEGRYVGAPSVFFRFGGCNLKCEGFGCKETAPDGTSILGCDTVYAVNKEHFSKNWIVINQAQELLNILNLYDLPSRPVDIVLTGGEPLLNLNDKIFLEFLQKLHKKGHRVTFETNATININFEKYPIYKEFIFALSVKLSNSKEELQKRVKGDVIYSIASNASEAFFKFSIDAESITLGLEEEIENILMHSASTQVYCMPLGGNKEEVELNTPALIEFCKAKGYNFSDRLHIRIWDINKGV